MLFGESFICCVHSNMQASHAKTAFCHFNACNKKPCVPEKPAMLAIKRFRLLSKLNCWICYSIWITRSVIDLLREAKHPFEDCPTKPLLLCLIEVPQVQTRRGFFL